MLDGRGTDDEDNASEVNTLENTEVLDERTENITEADQEEQTEYTMNPLFEGFRSELSDIDIATTENDTQETITKLIEIKTPMLVYIPNLATFLNYVKLTDSEAKKFIRKAKDKEVHFIFQTQANTLTMLRDGLGKYIKQMTKTGFVGQRAADQTFVNIRKNHSEPHLDDGEHSYFNKKMIERIRAVIIDD